MLEAGQIIGRYRIVELIGSGGMGEVYLAEDTELQRRVAIKLFTREHLGGATARDHLLHEARSASALSHPNVCTVFEVGEDDGRPFIAMEFVQGRTLDALVATRDLPAERVVRYGAQIADAIAHAHERGVIHRDLKSANVVITDDGRAKVLDFGLASTTVDDTEGVDAATKEVTSAIGGHVSGTLSHMAPELLRGQDADARSDIWSLGVLLFEASAGRLPFTGETAFAVSTAIMKDSAEIPVGISPGLRAVIQRCLQKAAGERYQSAAEVRAALEMLQSGGATSNEALSAEVAEAARRASPSRWPAFAAVFSVIAVVALALFVAFGPLSRTGDVSTAPASGPAIGASGRPTVAVLPFRDHTDAEDMAWLADGVPSMLLTSLAQTQGLDVVSASRVQQIIAQLGEESLEDLDAATLAEFADRSGAGAVIVGDLYYTGTEYRFDVQVEDVAGGRVLSAYSATGPFVFSLVDELSSQIRTGLELGGTPAARSIADVTSDSLEAWRDYEEGMRSRSNVRYPQAVAAFQEAIRLDPEFALAYFYLARLPIYLPDPSKASEYDEFVLANMDRIPERDRLYVEAIYALGRDNDPARAAELLEELVALYPDHEQGWVRLAQVLGNVAPGGPGQIDALLRGIEAMPASGILHNQLGYSMLNRGRYPEAVRAIERYVELNPEEANAYDSLAEIYTVSGQPEVGFEKYTEIIAVDPGWYGSYLGRTMTLAMLGRYDEALEEIEKFQETWLAASPTPSIYGVARGYLLAKIGRYDEAVEAIKRDQETLAAFGLPDLAVATGALLADIAIAGDDLATAREVASATLANIENIPDPGFRNSVAVSARAIEGIIDAREGDHDSATRMLADLQSDERNDFLDFGPVLLAAEIALATGDLPEAERLFADLEPEIKAFYSATETPQTLLANNNAFRDGPARVKVAQGELEAAIRIYRSLLTINTGSKYTSFLDPRYVFELAKLLDETGQED